MASNNPVTEGDASAFVAYLRNFTDGELRRLSMHFGPDMVYVTENEFYTVLSDLTYGSVISHEEALKYTEVEKRQDASNAAEMLVSKILNIDKEVGIGLWKTLYTLTSKSSHPNLHGMIEEILRNGKALLEEIKLNEYGHILDPYLKVCQDDHKSLLCRQTHLLEESGERKFEGQRYPLLNRYVELKVVSDAHFGKQSQCEHEALAAAGELNEYRLRHRMQSVLERITPDRLFHWCSRLKRKPCSVMVSGVAGIGKTTLVQKFVFDWAMEKHYQMFTFVFYFKFRDLNSFGPKTSLENLILREYPKLSNHLDTILQKPEQLLFIFDGLDESKSDLDLRSQEFCSLPSDVKPINVIVASLLKQTLLKGCSLLLTSRPSKLAQLETGVLHRVTSIVGFLSQEREQYFENFFGDHKVAQEALAHVRDGQVLYTLCYNPSYCWITCTALQPCFSSKKGPSPPLPKTVTQLFVRYARHMLDHHTLERPGKKGLWDMLTRLGWLADYGLKNHVLVFDRNLLACFDVKETPLLTAFLVESIHGDPSSSQVTYSFVHLTVQEFFAALVHYLDYNEGEFEDTMKRVEASQDGTYEIFLRFLSGLSHPATRMPLEEVLGKFSAVTTRRVIDWLVQVDYSNIFSKEDSDLLNGNNAPSKRKALNFFSLLYEAHNPQLVRQGMGDATCLDFSELYLMPVDCTILSYILKCFKTIPVLNLESCLIQNEGLQKLSSQLHKVKELSLSNNDLRDPAMTDLYSALIHANCQLETLRLAQNRLTVHCCKELGSALARNHSLLCLDLKKNKLRDEGLSDLLEAFRSPQCKIHTLLIQENGLSDKSCGIFSAALAQNTILKTLNLSGNHFTDCCVQEMSNFILMCPALTEIRLSLTDITPAVENRLKSLASKRQGFKIVI